MVRRLIALAGLALAFVGAVPPAPAQNQADAPPPVTGGIIDPGQAPAEPDPTLAPPAQPAADEVAPLGQARPVKRSTRPAPGASAGEPATLDPQVQPAQTPADAPAAQVALSADRFPMGAQSVALGVEVQAPATANLGKETTYKIVVKNSGTADALDVVVRDVLPPAWQFVSSRPDAKAPAWSLGTLAAGAEKTISVTVKPTQPGSFEHAATVVAMGGSRARTLVNSPKLRVEQLVDAKQETRGRQLQFTIKVTNTGTGPASNVTVKAKLSKGLKHPEGQELYVPVKAVKGNGTLAQGETVPLDLIVDTVAGGPQTCEVVASSPDVADDAEAHSTATVNVVEPKLALEFVRASSKRYPNTLASYTLRVSNPGTAPAKKVKLAAYLSSGGRLQDKGGGTYFPEKPALLWAVPELEPGGSDEHTFTVLMGGPQTYRIDAIAVATDCDRQEKTMRTEVLGTPLVDFTITDRRQAIDVGEETIYEIRISNKGTMEASDLILNAELSAGLVPKEFGGLPDDQKADLDGQRIKFPLIPSLAPGKTMLVEIKVEAKSPGLARCTVQLMHKELGQDRIEHTQHTRVLDPNGPGR